MWRMTGRELLAANLKRQRGLRDFSQEELADLASIDRTYISSLERCLYAASVDIIDRLANALGVEPAELLRCPPAGP
jgi:transcriptional regulator with XRE-family HTH domain